MLDVKKVFKAMEKPLKDYCQVKGVHEIDENSLIQEPKLVYSYSSPFRFDDLPMMSDQQLVASNDPNFSFDIEYTYVSNPRIKLTIRADTATKDKTYLMKAHEWFRLYQYGRRFFDYVNVVVVDIGDIRKDSKATNQNKEIESFDVVLQFHDEIKFREKTIESISFSEFNYKNNY